MEITREKHIQYMTKLTPALIGGCLIQAYLYQKFVPSVNPVEVTMFLLSGVAMIIAAFVAHHHLHSVSLHQNYVKIKMKGLDYEEDLLYRDIVELEVAPSKRSFSHVTFSMRDGRKLRVFYIDDAPEIKRIIEERRSRL